MDHQIRTPNRRKEVDSMNRSQRCGTCRGCQAKPCGQCTYCQDSPQFGGPGVKKQSCLERRCLRVLANRLQRDAPGFRARRHGCGVCDGCRMRDCQACLVCLDRRFFDGRYLPQAICAKKRCSQARNYEPASPVSSDFQRSSPILNGHFGAPHRTDFDAQNNCIDRHSNGLYAPMLHGAAAAYPQSSLAAGSKRRSSSPGLTVSHAAKLVRPYQPSDGSSGQPPPHIIAQMPSYRHSAASGLLDRALQLRPLTAARYTGSLHGTLCPVGISDNVTEPRAAMPRSVVLSTPQGQDTPRYYSAAVDASNNNTMVADKPRQMTTVVAPMVARFSHVSVDSRPRCYDKHSNGGAYSDAMVPNPQWTTTQGMSANLAPVSDSDPFVPPSQQGTNVVLQSL